MAKTFLKNDDAGKLFIRVAVGVILFFHGIFKLQHGIAWMKEPLAAWHLPMFFGYFAYLAEVLAPIMLIFGIRTRLAALLVIGDMLFAIFMVMNSQILTVKDGGGGWGIEVEAFFLLSSIALFLMGGGKYGLSNKSAWD